MRELVFYKEFEGARFPERGSEYAAGLDFFIPKPTSVDDKCFKFMYDKIIETLEKESNNISKDCIKCVQSLYEVHSKSVTEHKTNPEVFFWTMVKLYNTYVFNVPNIDEMTITSVDNNISIVLPVSGSINIPSGISVSLPHGYALDFRNKSGIATKKNIVVGAELVDEDYTGIMHLNLHNIGSQSQKLNCGQKIVQGVIEKTYYDELVFDYREKHNPSVTKRGDGGFGSTGA